MSTDGPFRIGDTLGGRYRLDAILGQGGMGIVYRATHLTLEQPVALKILLRSDPDAERRFFREARIAGFLKSEHVARVIDAGKVAEGQVYLAMEYLDGEDLAAVVKRRGALPVELAVTYVLHACHALAEAHARGIVHRDVKPSNLMLTEGFAGRPCVKVLDFGIAKATGAATGAQGTVEGRLTATAAGMGSPLYMAPEQIADAARVDARADIWSLGVTLYQLLTKATPWTGDSLLTVVSQLVSQPPAPISTHRSDVPPQLAAVISQCLERDPGRRWPNVLALAAALAPFGDASCAGLVKQIAEVHRLQPIEPERSTEPMPPPSAPGVARTAAGSVGRGSSRVRWPVVVGGAVVVLVLAGAAVMLRAGASQVAAASTAPSAPAIASAPALPAVEAPSAAPPLPPTSAAPPATALAAPSAPHPPKPSGPARPAPPAPTHPAPAEPPGGSRL